MFSLRPNEMNYVCHLLIIDVVMKIFLLSMFSFVSDYRFLLRSPAACFGPFQIALRTLTIWL